MALEIRRDSVRPGCGLDSKQRSLRLRIKLGDEDARHSSLCNNINGRRHKPSESEAKTADNEICYAAVEGVALTSLSPTLFILDFFFLSNVSLWSAVLRYSIVTVGVYK